MLLYTFGSAMCSFIAFLFRTECQASRISLCRHADDLSTISTLSKPPSTEEEVSRETKRVAQALATNNYPANFIHNGRQLSRKQEINDIDHRGFVIGFTSV